VGNAVESASHTARTGRRYVGSHGGQSLVAFPRRRRTATSALRAETKPSNSVDAFGVHVVAPVPPMRTSNPLFVRTKAASDPGTPDGIRSTRSISDQAILRVRTSVDTRRHCGSTHAPRPASRHPKTPSTSGGMASAKPVGNVPMPMNTATTTKNTPNDSPIQGGGAKLNLLEVGVLTSTTPRRRSRPAGRQHTATSRLVGPHS